MVANAGKNNPNLGIVKPLKRFEMKKPSTYSIRVYSNNSVLV